MDVVYVVGEHTEELRYSLRSLRNVEHDRVWIVGSRPAWATDVGIIEVGDQWEKARNITDKLYAAASHPDVSDPFAYFNDDFFALAPAEIPNRHRGKVDVKRPRGHHNQRLSLKESRLWTFWHLRETWGIDPVISYDLVHTPMMIDKAGLVAAVDASRRVKLLAPQVRSLYGNLQGVGGEEGPNAKLGHAKDTVGNRVWVSTNVISWNGKAGEEIRALFPDPSPYERI